MRLGGNKKLRKSKDSKHKKRRRRQHLGSTTEEQQQKALSQPTPPQMHVRPPNPQKQESKQLRTEIKKDAPNQETVLVSAEQRQRPMMYQARRAPMDQQQHPGQQTLGKAENIIVQKPARTLPQPTEESTDATPKDVDEKLHRDTLIKCIAGITSFLDAITKPEHMAQATGVERLTKQKQIEKISGFVCSIVHGGLDNCVDGFEKINLTERPLPSHLASDQNPKECRFNDIHCIDQTRVVLHKEESSKHKSDFIHANRLSISDTRELILTQLPLPHTVPSFWQLLWQENVGIVLMILTQQEWDMFGENVGLFPQTGCQTLSNGFTIIFRHESRVSKDISAKIYHISLSGYKKPVYFIHYKGWPHDLAPDNSDEIWQIQALLKKYNKGPAVIMSLSGVGRAGCYATLEVIHDQLHNPEVKEGSIAKAIDKVRQHRMFAVQSPNHLSFIQLAIVDHFSKLKKIKAVINPKIHDVYASVRQALFEKISQKQLSAEASSPHVVNDHCTIICDGL